MRQYCQQGLEKHVHKEKADSKFLQKDKACMQENLVIVTIISGFWG